ncbi:MAG: DNA polymerase III subunit gamma/tau [Candidatus Dormibacteria bacterium]
MSIALYRKYRSATFAELIGQDHIARTLRNEVRDGGIAHAYLFAGIRGTGKTSAARILARAVNCLDLQAGEPCNRCQACHEIVSGAAVDVLEIDAASNRGIEDMRDLREKVKYLPASLRRKVYIIDEAHMLTTEAWNAFLKTLEEPPEHVLFVLATTEAHKVPETVRSRVQRFDFRRVPGDAVVAHLGRVVAAEGTEVEPEALDLLARSGGGSVRDSLSLLDAALAGGERPLSLLGVRRALGLAHPGLVAELLGAIAAGEAAAALRACATAFEAGADARQLLREAARLARGAEFFAMGYPEGAAVGVDDAELCRRLATVAPPGLWVRALEGLAATELALRQPVDARLQVELCLLRLVGEVRAAPGGLGDLHSRVAALEAAAVPTGRPPVPAQAGRQAKLPPPPSAAAAPASPGTAAPVDGRTPVGAAPPPADAPPERPSPRLPPAVASAPPGVPAAPDSTIPPLDPAPVVEAPAPPAAAPAAGSLPAPAGPPAAPAGPAPAQVAALGTPASSLGPLGEHSPGIPGAWSERWGVLVDAVNRRDVMLAGVLRGCHPDDRAAAGVLRVIVPGQFHLSRLNDPAKRRLIGEVATEVGGSAVEVEAVLDGAAVTSDPAAAANGDRPDATQAVLEAFPGSRIVASRLRDTGAERGGSGR